MRDYPTVPNVFRVASSHSVDADCVISGGCDIKITSGTNANLPKGQLKQQQQQQNGNISGQQQSLVKSSISSQTTKTTTTTLTPTTTTQNSAATTKTTSSTVFKTSTAQQKEQQTTKNDLDFIMHNHNGLQQPSQHPYKLTTHASIERPQCLRTSQSYLQQSPYATLPRNATSSLLTLSLVSPNAIVTDSDIRKQQQEHHNSTSTNNNNGNNNSQTNTITSTKDSAMLGVINTISGSIPATGYTVDQLPPAKTNSNGGTVVFDHHRTTSVGSDLNVVMNNSCTNLSKLNGVQQQKQQQKHLRLHQQQLANQQRDFKQSQTASTTTNGFTTYKRPYPCSSLERNTNGYLWIITPVAASISVAIVIAALAGPQWLFTEEKLPNTLYNGTANFNVLDDGAFITRYTKSSLWIICTTLQGVETYSCIKIDYFSEKVYLPDPHDSASAIPYTVTKSCPFFLVSGIVLLLSFIVFLIPTCSHKNNLYYFSAGIMFIVSGLLMLIGLIAYISILKAEIGSKLRPRSTLQPPLFKVTYGQSFFLFVFGFIATEFVGLLNIFLYISLQDVGYYSRLPCFTISNIQEKIKEGENRFNSHTYKSYKHDMESKKPTEKMQKQNRKHQVTAQELELDTTQLLKNMTQRNSKNSGGNSSTKTGRKIVDAALDVGAGGQYACRKHPNGLGSMMFLNELDRRYYFEKPSTSSTQSKCNLHSRNLAKSLNELYTETLSSSALLPPPPPSSVRAGGLQLHIQNLPRPPQQFSDAPQEFPLTRSVSTTTDIYATQNVSFGGVSASKTDTFTSNNRRRNVATNTRYFTSEETQTNGGGSGKNNNTKAQLQQYNNNIKHLRKQQHNQRQHNIYRTNNAATKCANDINDENDLADDAHHNHQQRTRQLRAIVNGHKVAESYNEEASVIVASDDDEEQPQKLCGLKRSIRKTKDELFEEFCKRAGVRPKPKNIYYIEDPEGVDDENVNAAAVIGNDDNASAEQSADVEEEMQCKLLRMNKLRTDNLHQRRTNTPGHHLQPQATQSQEQHRGGAGGMENNHIFGDAIDVVDIDEHVDEDGFKKLTESEDHLYVIDDYIHLMPQAIRNGRRASMYVEPTHLRRLNSNLSLHAIYAPSAARASMQKSLYDLDTSGNEFSFITAEQQYHQPLPRHALRNSYIYGGSQQRLQQDYHHNSQAMYQSRTLPRTFLKHNGDSQDSIASAGLNASATQLHNPYSTSQQRLTTLMMKNQQKMQQQNRYLSMSREHELYNSRYGLHKSNEELNRHYMQQPPIYMQPHQLQQYQQQQQHAKVASTSYSTTSTLKQPHIVQWPAAIPSSPSNFSGSFRMYGPATTQSTTNTNHALPIRSNSNNADGPLTAGGQQVVVNGVLTSSQGPPKFQRAYAFDEQRRRSAVLADAFDLDEIERERRRSHASLFSGLGVDANTEDHYDIVNGTAV